MPKYLANAVHGVRGLMKYGFFSDFISIARRKTTTRFIPLTYNPFDMNYSYMVRIHRTDERQTSLFAAILIDLLTYGLKWWPTRTGYRDMYRKIRRLINNRSNFYLSRTGTGEYRPYDVGLGVGGRYGPCTSYLLYRGHIIRSVTPGLWHDPLTIHHTLW